MDDALKVQQMLEMAEPYAKALRSVTVPSEVILEALEYVREQDNLGEELTNALELVHKRNERIAKLEELLKESKQKTIDELRKEMMMMEKCEECERDERDCEFEYRYCMRDFCDWFDIAVEKIQKRNRLIGHKTGGNRKNEVPQNDCLSTSSVLYSGAKQKNG